MEESHIDHKTEIEDEVKWILKLIKDGELDMDGTPEEILKREPVAELVKKIENIINELNVLEEVIEDRDDLKVEIEKLKLEISTMVIKHDDDKKQMIDYFNLQCHNKIAAPMGILEKKKREVEEQLRASEHELNTLKQKVSDCEKEISDKQNEIRQLAVKNLEQEDKLGKLEKARKSECSALQRKLNTAEKDASGKQKDLLSLQKAKEALELYCEKLKEEHAQTLTSVDNQKNELSNKIMDLRRKLEEQEDAYHELIEEYKQVDSRFNECKVKLEVANRKIEEKAEELRESIASKDKTVDDLEHQVEDLKKDLEEKGNETSTLLESVENHEEKLRLSNQKLRDTEQLLSEKEESFRKVEEELQKVQRELEDRRNATPVARITANNEPYHATMSDIKVCADSVKIGIDTASKKFSDDCNNHENSIKNISDKLQVAKEYASEMNREKEKLQNDNKEEVLTLREKVEKLEAKARKEESEKMNEIMDLQRTLKERKDAYQKLNEEYIQIGSGFNECKVNLEDAKRKMEQMEEEFHERIESKNRIVADLDHQVEELMELLKPKA